MFLGKESLVKFLLKNLFDISLHLFVQFSVSDTSDSLLAFPIVKP